MILYYPALSREITTASFPDIPVACVRVEQSPTTFLWEIEFDGDLTKRQQWQVRLRVCSPDDTTEALMVGLFDSMLELRQIKNSTGTLSSANLSNAVRAIATAILRQARLTFGDTEDLPD